MRKIIISILLLCGLSAYADNSATWDKRAYLPFEVIAAIADARLEEWSERPSELSKFSLKKPTWPEYPKTKTLTKGEFETTQQFEARLAIAQRSYDTKVIKQDKKYAEEKANYAKALQEYKLSLEVETRRRQAQSQDKYWEYVFEAFAQELGEPLIKLIEYNADLGVFYAILTSSKSLFSQWLAIRIPLDSARSIQNDADKLLPVLRFDKNTRNQLIISNAHITYGKHKYSAQLINKPDNLSRVIKETVNSKRINDYSGSAL